jgi:hypothetical protein
MVGAALAMAMVSLGRSILADQWLLARAAAAKKHCIYSIFVSEPGSNNSNGLCNTSGVIVTKICHVIILHCKASMIRSTMMGID